MQPDFAGKPIRLATRPQRLHVTAADVAAGQPGDKWNCPYAQCARRLPRAVRACFLKTVAWVEYPTHVKKYKLPPSMTTETKVADAHGDFEPGEYELKPYPARSKPTGKVSGSGRTGPPVYRHISGYVR